MPIETIRLNKIPFMLLWPTREKEADINLKTGELLTVVNEELKTNYIAQAAKWEIYALRYTLPLLFVASAGFGLSAAAGVSYIIASVMFFIYLRFQKKLLANKYQFLGVAGVALLAFGFLGVGSYVIYALHYFAAFWVLYWMLCEIKAEVHKHFFRVTNFRGLYVFRFQRVKKANINNIVNLFVAAVFVFGLGLSTFHGIQYFRAQKEAAVAYKKVQQAIKTQKNIQPVQTAPIAPKATEIEQQAAALYGIK